MSVNEMEQQYEVSRLASVWDRGKVYLAAGTVGVLATVGLTACDPDGPGSLPDIPIRHADPAPEHQVYAESAAEPAPPPMSPKEIEQNNRNIEKFFGYRQMIDAINNFAATRGAHVEDPGWFFEQYEGAEKISGVPKEVVLAVHGIESTFARELNDRDSYVGPMQMGVREFNMAAADIHLPPNRGAKHRSNSHYALRAGARYLQILGARADDPHSIEMALRRYNSGSTRGGVGYARLAMKIAREAGYDR